MEQVLKLTNRVITTSFFNKLKPHIELVAVIVSGLLILGAWLIDTNNHNLSIALYLVAFIIGGFAKAKEGIEETIASGQLNVEMLMIFAAVGSAVIGYWTEGAALIFIFALSGALETYTMNKSQKEISALMDLQPEMATLLTDGEEKIVSISDLQIGDFILVKPGERLPIDGLITKGNTTIDEASITGESIPVTKTIEDEVFAGTVNLSGSLTVKMTKPSSESLFQKILELVQSAQSAKSPSQLFIERFEGKYVKAVIISVLLMLFIPHFALGWSWNESFYRAMVLMVVASPCALVASITPATLSAISNGARHGILFKGGVHLEKLSHLQAIAFDKTGTLTTGKPEVTNFYVRPELNEEVFFQMAASVESHSNHPLAQAIVKYAKQRELVLLQPDSLEDLPGWGVKAHLSGSNWKIGKADFVGIEQIQAFAGDKAQAWAEEGKTVIFVEDDIGIAGMIALQDKVRDVSKKALELLKDMGIRTVMLTGDNEKTAQRLAAELQIDHYIANCLPEEKMKHLEKLKENYGTVAMVGDGINDAPSLATADVGIAMGEGTDVALETADIVLMKNELSRIAQAIDLSHRMQKIVKQNVIFSISVIALLICSNLFQILNLPLGVIGHEGSTILVILNGVRLLKDGKQVL